MSGKNFLTKFNKSFTYIFPMFGESIMQFYKTDKGSNQNEGLLKNTYIRSNYKPEYKNHFFVEYKNSEHYSNFFEKWIKMNEHFVDEYEEDDRITFVFSVPLKYQEDYDNFIKSKYSKFGDGYKRKVLKFHHINFNSRVSKVMYKDPSLYKIMEAILDCDPIPRELEIESLIDMDAETHTKREVKVLKKTKEKVQWE